MNINVSAGHGKDGEVGCGAVGLIKESTEARKVKNLVIKYLKAEGHTVNDCTVDVGKDANDILKKIVKKCNAHDVDLDVSIHFNSGVSDKKGNDKTTGTEVLIYNAKSKAYDEAKRVCDKIAKLGFKNRGIKLRSDLYFLNSTNAPAMLIEVCFVDDKDDVELYEKNVDKIAKAIVEGIQNKAIKKETTTKKEEVKTSTFKEYRVKIDTEVLKIRKGAGTKYGTNGSVKKGEVYTIVDEKYNGKTLWGKLKSGRGYISLGYTKKV